MNEAAAAEVLLLRAFETSGSANWSEADRAGATRTALQAVGADAPTEDFLAARAQAGLQKLAPRDALLARWRALRPWRIEGLLLALVLGFAAGLLVDRIGSSQRINLLAPPVWAAIVWNLAVYVVLLWQALRSPSSQPGWLRRGAAALLQRWRSRRLRAGGDAAGTGTGIGTGTGTGTGISTGADTGIGSGMGHSAGNSAKAWNTFAADWATLSLPLNTARIALMLHLGAAALGLGLLAGLYLRGLVLDYRVGWESTFLDAGSVHSLLSTLFAPASALSGIAVPDVAALQALRVAPGAVPAADAAAAAESAAAAASASASASAAPWIHLYALQLLLFVLLPRLALALWTGVRARYLQQHVALPLHEPYFQHLRWQQRGGRTPVWVWPHGRAPDAVSLEALKALFARVLGEGATLQIAPTVAYGAEDEPLALPAEGVLRVALFELGATPEAETQGRLLRALAAPGAAPACMLIDEAAFAQRFGATSQRLPERRQAWSALAVSVGCTATFVNLRSSDLSAAETALQAALMSAAAAATERS